MKQQNLTEGNILEQITRLSIPIMGTGFIQMSYQLMDMFWLGKGSSDWVASSAMAGYAMWIANALCLITRLGAEIGVGHAVGSEDNHRKKQWIDSALFLAFLLSVAYGLLIYRMSHPIVSFFGIVNEAINRDGVVYLRIIALGMPFTFFNPLMVGFLNAAGDSKTSFIVNSAGIIINMVLDPILIFTFRMGVAGAAVATVIAQGVISLLFLFYVMPRHGLFEEHRWFRNIRQKAIWRIITWGAPSGIQSIFFASVSALISRFVAEYGASAFAAYRIGVEIESIGWLTLMGLSSALTAFIAQNYGAQKPDRVWKGFLRGTSVGVIVAGAATIVLVFGAGFLMSLFIGQDLQALTAGTIYLIVAGFSQIPMSLDYTASGAFQGMGNTLYPSLGGIFGNILRIPMALALSKFFGLNGIFYAIALSAILKGVILYPWFIYYFRNETRIVVR